MVYEGLKNVNNKNFFSQELNCSGKKGSYTLSPLHKALICIVGID